MFPTQCHSVLSDTVSCYFFENKNEMINDLNY